MNMSVTMVQDNYLVYLALSIFLQGGGFPLGFPSFLPFKGYFYVFGYLYGFMFRGTNYLCIRLTYIRVKGGFRFTYTFNSHLISIPKGQECSYVQSYPLIFNIKGTFASPITPFQVHMHPYIQLTPFSRDQGDLA